MWVLLPFTKTPSASREKVWFGKNRTKVIANGVPYALVNVRRAEYDALVARSNLHTPRTKTVKGKKYVIFTVPNIADAGDNMRANDLVESTNKLLALEFNTDTMLDIYRSTSKVSKMRNVRKWHDKIRALRAEVRWAEKKVHERPARKRHDGLPAARLAGLGVRLDKALRDTETLSKAKRNYAARDHMRTTPRPGGNNLFGN